MQQLTEIKLLPEGMYENILPNLQISNLGTVKFSAVEYELLSKSSETSTVRYIIVNRLGTK